MVQRAYHLWMGPVRSGPARDDTARDDTAHDGPLRNGPGSFPLVGRDTDLRQVLHALTAPASKVVTLTGPPGVGKTRLATAVSRAAAPRFPGGVVTADLSTVHGLDAAAMLIGRAFGVGSTAGTRTVDRVRRWSTDRTMLLVLDSCERVSSLAEVVGPMVTASPRLRLLATSQQPLHLASEQQITVAPLPVPSAEDVVTPEQVGDIPSVQVLLHAGGRAGADVRRLDREDAQALVRICARLDGLPLALEIAGARLAEFGPAALAARLEERDQLLDATRSWGPSRHRSLRAAIDWSHALLAEEERQVFRRLAVFPGRFTVRAAEAVAGGEPGRGTVDRLDVLAITAALAERQLLTAITTDDVPAFRMLDSLREYALEQLTRHREADDIRRRHARYFVELAHEAEAGFGTEDEDMWQAWVLGEHHNIRAALDYSLARTDLASALSLVAVIGWFWYARGYLGEGQRAVERALSMVESTRREPPESPFAGALLIAGVLSFGSGEHDRAQTLLTRSLALSERCGDRRRTAITHAFLSQVAGARGRYAEAYAENDLATRIQDELDNPRGVAWAWFDRGMLELSRDNPQPAASHLERARAWFGAHAQTWPVAWCLWGLGRTAWRYGDPPRARRLFTESLEAFAASADRRGVAQCLECLALTASAAGEHRRAGELVAAADVVRDEIGLPPSPGDRAQLARLRRRVARSLGAAASREAQQIGATTPWAVLLAGADGGAPDGAGATGPNPRGASTTRTVLTARQGQVAALVAQGLTNRQICQRLHISEKTVEAHLSHIMTRLDVASRAEVAVHAVAAGLYRPERPDRPEE